MTAVVEKVCLSTAIEQALVSPKLTSFGWQAKGKLVSIPAPTEWPVQGRWDAACCVLLLGTRRRIVFTDYSWAGASRELPPLPNTCYTAPQGAVAASGASVELRRREQLQGKGPAVRLAEVACTALAAKRL